MASVNFQLKNANEKRKPSVLYIQIVYKVGEKFQKLKFSTGEKLLPKEWNQKKQLSIFPELNDYLVKLRKRVNRLVTEAKLNGYELSNQYFKDNWSDPDDNSKKTF